MTVCVVCTCSCLLACVHYDSWAVVPTLSDRFNSEIGQACLGRLCEKGADTFQAKTSKKACGRLQIKTSCLMSDRLGHAVHACALGELPCVRSMRQPVQREATLDPQQLAKRAATGGHKYSLYKHATPSYAHVGQRGSSRGVH